MKKYRKSAYVWLQEFDADGYVEVDLYEVRCKIEGEFTAAQLRKIADTMDRLVREVSPTEPAGDQQVGDQPIIEEPS